MIGRVVFLRRSAALDLRKRLTSDYATFRLHYICFRPIFPGFSDPRKLFVWARWGFGTEISSKTAVILILHMYIDVAPSQWIIILFGPDEMMQNTFNFEYLTLTVSRHIATVVRIYYDSIRELKFRVVPIPHKCDSDSF